ncbi:MAG: hypothetical protein FWE22_07760 [Firmicutes bacterium]|nr:hypothetical protein [Bacillota bacterium]
MERLLKEFEELLKDLSSPLGSGEERAWRVLRKKRFKRVAEIRNCEQLSFITPENSSIDTSSNYIETIKKIILEKHDTMEIHYNDIAKIVFENSMLTRRDIINKIIKPLIKEGHLTKIPTVNNYRHKDAYYLVSIHQQ